MQCSLQRANLENLANSRFCFFLHLFWLQTVNFNTSVQLFMQIFIVHICGFFLFAYLVLFSVYCPLLHRQGVSHSFREPFCYNPLSFWFDRRRAHKTYFWMIFYIFFYFSDFGVCTWRFFQCTSFQQWWHHIAAGFTERLRQTDSLRCHCPP